ncbi:mechanosensitive ion channel protein MscS [Halorhodospira abdelmalekii]|uniref:mechanosensitive ion channel domain-containing protein n=1 Tax=Halorhodospira abdelmalekii TaxID=421629 RepID=UPI00190766E9|nr:mechanosensitive ion channel domain-containing protein [Halorhodospira abdelmalekii]MBK1735390.1 mechanosensitive ion channel protein MscS [Halorhodospira abdelmalekii]
MLRLQRLQLTDWLIRFGLVRFGCGALALLPLLAAAENGNGEAEPLAPARRIAELSQAMAQWLNQTLRDITATFEEIETAGLGNELLTLAWELGDLLIIIAVTIALLLALRPIARPFFRRAEQWAQRGDERLRTIRRTIGVSAAAVADLVTIVLAWLGGYALALFVLGEVGEMEMRQSLFLNAFLLVEGAKALLRILFATRNDGLRLLPMSADYAHFWYARLSRISGLIGYGLLFLVPLFSQAISEQFGQVITLLLMVAVFGYALTLALRHRRDVRQRLEARAAATQVLVTRTVLATLAWTWHWLVIAYFGTLAVITVTQPETALPYMAQATAQSVLIIALGALLAVALTQATARRIQLSDAKRRHFPLLEQRLNAYVPIALKLVRIVIVLGVCGLLLHAWGLFDFLGWLGSESGLHIVGVVLSVAFILIAALGAWLIAASWIEHRLNPNVGKRRPSAREQTLLTLFRNALAVVLVTMTVMIVLAEIGINIGPLIAGAGVLGLAIGFGAQKLVQDIITGVFIQLENAIDVGDIVTAGGVTGTVEKLTVRSVNIRDLAGTYHFIPFSSVDSIANFTRHFAYHVGDYGIAYRESVDAAKPHLEAAYKELKDHPNPDIAAAVLDEFWIDGVSSLGDSAVHLRVRIKTAPGMQWAVGRAYNELVKKHLDAAGIEIPFPHRTVYFGEPAAGADAPALPGKGATAVE